MTCDRIGTVVGGADLIPEVAGARVVVVPEGGQLPNGFHRVLFRVHHRGDPRWFGWSPLPRVSEWRGRGQSVLLVAP